MSLHLYDYFCIYRKEHLHQIQELNSQNKALKVENEKKRSVYEKHLQSKDLQMYVVQFAREI